MSVNATAIGVPGAVHHERLPVRLVERYGELVHANTSPSPFVLALASRSALYTAIGTLLPGKTAMDVIHVGHAIEWERGVAFDGAFATRATPLMARETRRGTIFAIGLDSGAGGKLVSHQVFTGLVPGPTTESASTDQAGSSPPARPAAARTLEVPLDVDLPARYAELSGDDAPIHVDGSAAQAAGFRDVICHGTAVLAVVWSALSEAMGAELRRSVSARFASPAYPGTLTVTEVHHGDGAVRFETLDERGNLVLSSGSCPAEPWPGTA
jgi:hypothetical protein